MLLKASTVCSQTAEVWMCVCIKGALLATEFRLLQTPGRNLAGRSSISTVHLHSGTGGTQFKSRLYYRLFRLKIFVVFFSLCSRMWWWYIQIGFFFFRILSLPQWSGLNLLSSGMWRPYMLLVGGMLQRNVCCLHLQRRILLYPKRYAVRLQIWLCRPLQTICQRKLKYHS